MLPTKLLDDLAGPRMHDKIGIPGGEGAKLGREISGASKPKMELPLRALVYLA
jgi:hypothetical protein